MGVCARWGRRLPVTTAVAFAVLLPAISSGGPIAAAAGAPPSAASASGAPLRVRSSSLSQRGRYLVWRLTLAQPFSPSALARAGRSLCLLIERAHGGSIAGQACVIGPARHSRVPRLVYSRVTAHGSGRGHTIRAKMTRSSPRELTAVFLPAHVRAGYAPLRWQVLSALEASACASPRPGAARCFSLVPSRPALLRLHTPEPVGCVAAGPSLVYHGRSHARELALTFDDGPWDDPPTVQFLQVLERAHAVATFFEIGEQIGSYDPTGAIERRMLADGDMIGDHTWSHPDMASLSAGAQRQQLEQTAAAIRHATHGFEPCLWRPPYGDISPSLVSLARSLGLITIMWDVDTRDWTLPGSATIYERAVSGAHDGAIILQHFGGGPRSQTLAALPHEISTLRHEGYRLVTVAQLLGLRLIYK
jgi:peptidoglycan/xylan/chitin deacetylase (PgdA/CDA1 family)